MLIMKRLKETGGPLRQKLIRDLAPERTLFLDRLIAKLMPELSHFPPMVSRLEGFMFQKYRRPDQPIHARDLENDLQMLLPAADVEIVEIFIEILDGAREMAEHYELPSPEALEDYLQAGRDEFAKLTELFD
jgi:hypothetical protein